MFEQIKLIEEHLREVLERNKSDNVRNDFFKVFYLGDLKFKIVYQEYKRVNYPDKYGEEYFTISCHFYGGSFSYDVATNDLKFNTTTWESRELYSYEVLKLIGYIVKSQNDKCRFFVFFEKIISTHMQSEVDLHNNSLENYIKNLIKIKSDISIANQFEEPSFLVIRNNSTEDKHQQRVGRDNKVYSTYTTWFTLKIINKENITIDKISSIENYLKTLAKSSTSSDSYYAPLGTDSYSTDSCIDISLSRKLLLHKGEDYSQMPDYSSKLTSEKIHFILFFLFGDLSKLISFQAESFSLYQQYLLCNSTRDLLKSNQYSIFDSDFKLDFQISSEIKGFIYEELYIIFDEEWLLKKIDIFIINALRMSNPEFLKLLITYFQLHKK